MSVQPITQTISVDDAVELVWERVLAGEYADVPEAVRSLWHSLTFSTDDLSFLGLYGLSEYATDVQRKTRSSSSISQRPAIGYGAPHGKKWDRYIGLTWPFDDAEGNPKSLLDFTADDLTAFATRAGTMIASYTRRRDWAVETSEQLKEHNVSRVRDLPAFALVEVDAAAREAMGRQE